MMQNFDDPVERDFKENVLPSLIPGVSKNIITGHSSGGDIFEIDLGTDFALGTPYDPQSTRFVHFTSLRALHSIVNENAVRLYSMINSNDPGEYYYFAEDLLESKNSLKVKENTYVLSLCDASILKSDNILNLWRLYGSGGWGVAIEFEIEFHGASTLPSDYFLGKVLYEKPNLENFDVRHSEFEQRNQVKADPTKLKRIPACFHKKPHYRIEEEVRLMSYDASSTARATFSPDQNKFKWDFNSRNELVTYNRLKLGQKIENPWITIKRIQFGFRHSEEFVEKMEKHFDNLFLSMKEERIIESTIESPEIKLSPLGKIYH